MSLVFEWDNRKARRNLEKHHVSFVEAVSVFNDPLARIFVDEDHPIGDPREIVIGHSSSMRLWLYVSQSRRRIVFASSAHGPPREESNTIMKKTSQVKARPNRADALRPEYHFDYRKAKVNRFAGKAQPESVAVLLDPDVARFFESGDFNQFATTRADDGFAGAPRAGGAVNPARIATARTKTLQRLIQKTGMTAVSIRPTGLRSQILPAALIGGLLALRFESCVLAYRRCR